MEVANLQLVSSGGISETTLPGTWVIGNHYVGTIEVECVPYSGTDIAMYGEFTIAGFNNLIVIPVTGSVITGCGSDILVNFDVYCLSVPEINYVLNANGGAGQFIVNVVVNKSV
jgi:hypothetical protein